MKISSINPYIRLAMHSGISAGHIIKQRVIYDYELLYLEEGEFTLYYGGVAYHCRQGDIIFIHPGIPHSFHLNMGRISQPHIHFDMTYRPVSSIVPISYKDFPDMSEQELTWIHNDCLGNDNITPFINFADKEAFLELFYKTVSSETDAITKKGLLIQIISLIIRDNYPNMLYEESRRSIVREIKDYIDAGNGMKMSLDDFASNFFHSKFHLEKKFKENFGVGLVEYRNKKRMEIADFMLQSRSVSFVAEELGYQSIYSFSRAYKNFYGFSPRNSKKRQKVNE